MAGRLKPPAPVSRADQPTAEATDDDERLRAAIVEAGYGIADSIAA
ncbi:hypothetical protein ACWGLF_06110 [Streptomyces puniciscabiei]